MWALIQNESDIGNIVLSSHRRERRCMSAQSGKYGVARRSGKEPQRAHGKGETVMGIAMLLKGENSRAVAGKISEWLQQVQKALPRAMGIVPVLRPQKDGRYRTVRTAVRNLIEGGLVVIKVIFCFCSRSVPA